MSSRFPTMEHSAVPTTSPSLHRTSHKPTRTAPLRRTRANPWARKPLWAIDDGDHGQPEVMDYDSVSASGDTEVHPEDDNNHGQGNLVPKALPRHLTLWNLVSIGVGGTIGSGIFVLCGLIAREYAGPATCLSWVAAGLTAFLSGCCYAELASHLPTEGSAYAYAYASMGELPAFAAAACLSLEFLVSGAAVARSWGDKVVEWLQFNLHAGSWVQAVLEPGLGVNPMACAISIGSTFLLLAGVKESKRATDVFTWMKVALVVVMSTGGFFFFQASNLRPLIPPQFGIMGVMRGATSSFFGYIGYDGMCCVAGEALNPRVNLPRAVLLTLIFVTVLYVTASISLTGMQNYTEISASSGFSLAFHAQKIEWLSQLVAFGEIFTLPIVVFIALFLQPRLQYALARDGLLPKSLAQVDDKGVLRNSSILDGIIMTVVATFVPFSYLDDFISSGILVSFSITDTSLLLMRMESPATNPFLLEKLLLAFNILSFTMCVALSHGLHSLVAQGFVGFSGVAILSLVYTICTKCHHSSTFGAAFGAKQSFARRASGTPGPSFASAPQQPSASGFRTPLVPLLPLVAIFANWYLVSQLDFFGILILAVYLLVTVQVYYWYGAQHSVWGHGRDEAMAVALRDGGTEVQTCAPYSDQELDESLQTPMVEQEENDHDLRSVS